MNLNRPQQRDPCIFISKFQQRLQFFEAFKVYSPEKHWLGSRSSFTRFLSTRICLILIYPRYHSSYLRSKVLYQIGLCITLETDPIQSWWNFEDVLIIIYSEVFKRRRRSYKDLGKSGPTIHPHVLSTIEVKSVFLITRVVFDR